MSGNPELPPLSICFLAPDRILLCVAFYFWVFVATGGLSLVAVSRTFSSCGARVSHGGGFSGFRAQTLGYSGFHSCPSTVLCSVAVARWLSCSTAHGIFLDQGSNSCPLHWQVDS